MERRDILKFALVGIASSVATLFLVGFFALFFFRGEISLSPLSGENTSAPISASSEKEIIEAVKKADPAVIAITISKNILIYERYYESIPGPWGLFFQIPQIRQQGTELLEVGGGSGFLVSADGYIVTNRHVVDDRNAEYTVFTNDGSQYPARVIVRDETLDIAIIKIEGANFPHLSLGDSDALEVGQTVIAIGNALAEFRNTVSVGVVSGLSRSIVAADSRGKAEELNELIQTDAAINQGNSGGPLLNLKGEVVGVNVAIASGAENIGFALSANVVKSVVDSVRQATGQLDSTIPSL
jgi:serine protease Do